MAKKQKKGFLYFYKNNRIYCILMILSLICLISIGTAVIVYFVKQTKSSAYGNRLNGIEENEATKEVNAIKDHLKAKEIITDYDVRVQGKIIYIDFYAKEEVKEDDLKNIATECLDLLTDSEKTYYDLQFVCKSGSNVAYFGSKSSTNQTISWARYSYDASEKE